MKTIARFFTIVLLAGALFHGCGRPAATSEDLTPSPDPSQTNADAASESASTALSETITLPDGWTLDQAVSAAEIEALVNDTGYTFFSEASSDAANGSPSGAFVKENANGKLKITFLAFVNAKEEKYNFFKDYVVEGTLQELDSEMWDKAFVGDFTDSSAAIVCLRGDLCIRINWFPEVYSQFDKVDFGTQLASLLINNLYGGAREATALEETDSAVAEAGDTASTQSTGLPDALPADLNDAASLNEYASTLYLDYVKPNIFKAPVFSDEEKEAARQALQLIIAAEDKAITLEPNNEHFYYVRGAAYAQCYYDTKNAGDKEKAMADLKKASDMGLAMATDEYNNIANQ